MVFVRFKGSKFQIFENTVKKFCAKNFSEKIKNIVKTM